jgi:hypothetical protein
MALKKKSSLRSQTEYTLNDTRANPAKTHRYARLRTDVSATQIAPRRNRKIALLTLKFMIFEQRWARYQQIP